MNLEKVHCISHAVPHTYYRGSLSPEFQVQELPRISKSCTHLWWSKSISPQILSNLFITGSLVHNWFPPPYTPNKTGLLPWTCVNLASVMHTAWTGARVVDINITKGDSRDDSLFETRFGQVCIWVVNLEIKQASKWHKLFTITFKKKHCLFKCATNFASAPVVFRFI